MDLSGLGILQGDEDLWTLANVCDSEFKKPLKEDMIRLRLEVWEQKHFEEKPEEIKSPFPDLEQTSDGSKQADKKPSYEELEKDWELDVGLYSPRFPRLVRDYLNSGVLANLVKEYSPKRANGAWTKDHRKLVVIAYCAMELGCALPPGFQYSLQERCYAVGLSRVGEHQIYQACEEYIDGKPFSFSSIDTRLTERSTLTEQGIGMDTDLWRHTQRAHTTPPGLEPLPFQEAAVETEQSAPKRSKFEAEVSLPLPVEEWSLRFPSDTCANCGATRSYMSPGLKRCKGCKTTLYCFEGCQKWHWPRHKCVVEQESEENAQGESAKKGGNVSKMEVKKTAA